MPFFLEFPNPVLTNFCKSAKFGSQNLSEARTVDHITPILASLHWRPVRFCVDFKILMLTCKALHGLAPQYLAELLTPSRNLCSSQSGLLLKHFLKHGFTLGVTGFSHLMPPNCGILSRLTSGTQIHQSSLNRILKLFNSGLLLID